MAELPKASTKTALRQRQKQEFKTLALALLVGAVSGYAAVLFYFAIGWLTELFYGAPEETLASHASSLPWWHILGVTVGIGFVVGQLLRFMEERRARGVPHVMESAMLGNARLPFFKGMTSAVITVLSLGGGASTGREGPAVHLGATLASSISQFFKLPGHADRTVLGCGAAAAVAASFNAPIAGVFFALEVVLGHYALKAFAPIVVAAVSGTLVSRYLIGDIPIFQVTDHEIISVGEFPAFFVLGILCAVIAALFMQSLETGERIRAKYFGTQYWLHPIIGGLSLGLIALAYPQVLGIGYEPTVTAIDAGYGLSTILPLVAAKFIATTVCLTFRFGGGVFSPGLVIGALAGGSFGLIIASIFPEFASSEGLYAIVGMGAVASAVLGAPISTVLIVFEITGDYSVSIAVMIASAASSLLVTYFKQGSLFHQQLRARGIFLEQGRASFLLHSSFIRDYASRDFMTIQLSDTVAHARNQLMIQLGGALVVTNESGHYVGLVNLGNLPNDGEFAHEKRLKVADIVDECPEPLEASRPLDYALSIMEESGMDVLPVVSETQANTVIGLLHYRHVLAEYNKALLISQGDDRD